MKEPIYTTDEIRHGWYSESFRYNMSQLPANRRACHPALTAHLLDGSPVTISVHSDSKDRSGLYYDDVVYVGEIIGDIYALED